MEENPDLLRQLEDPNYQAQVERAVILTVEAFDWNCPQHITPRYTEAENEAIEAPLKERISELENLLQEQGIDYDK